MTKMPAADEVMAHVMLLLMLVKPQDSARTDGHLLSRDLSRDLHVDIAVSPPAPQTMLVGSRLSISVLVTSVMADNWTCYEQPTSAACDADVVLMFASSNRPSTVGVLVDKSNPTNDTLIALMPFSLNHSVDVVVDALSVGRAVLVLELSAVSKTHTKIGAADVDLQYAAAAQVYTRTVLRCLRCLHDPAFIHLAGSSMVIRRAGGAL